MKRAIIVGVIATLAHPLITLAFVKGDIYWKRFSGPETPLIIAAMMFLAASGAYLVVTTLVANSPRRHSLLFLLEGPVAGVLFCFLGIVMLVYLERFHALTTPSFQLHFILSGLAAAFAVTILLAQDWFQSRSQK